jgi:cytosol alanyl aminopeptidase
MLIKRSLEIVSKLLLLLYFTHVSAQEYRLSHDIQAHSQQIYLELDPADKAFIGSTELQITVTRATDHIAIYSQDLQLSNIYLSSSEATIPLTSLAANEFNIVKLKAEQTLDAGEYTLSIKFSGKYRDDGNGLFKVSQDQHHYLYTQFQPMLARTVFPGFDQPDFKLPFTFKVKVPEKYQVVSNQSVAKESVVEGQRLVSFKPTQALYTDTLALAVGEFDVIDIPNMPLPAKLYVNKGMLPQSRYYLPQIAKLFNQVQGFFDTPYPYGKLDFLVAPEINTVAMENAGLIMFRAEDFLAINPPGSSRKAFIMETIAHEIAHMWFGNLVTMTWWDDYWLNESFAEWLAYKVMQQSEPTLYPWLDMPTAYLADDTANSKALQRQIKSFEDVESYGDIVYQKGPALLQMLAQYIGEDKFKLGLNRFIDKYASDNASLTDLLRELDLTSEKHSAPMLQSFLQRGGFPLLNCTLQDNTLTVSQSQFEDYPEGQASPLWTIPIGIKLTDAEGNILSTLQILLSNKEQSFTVPVGTAAIFPNLDGIGYFLYKLPDASLKIINKHIDKLSPMEKVSWLQNMELLAGKGLYSYPQMLQTKITLLANPQLNEHLSAQLLRDLDFSYAEVIPPELYLGYSRYLSDVVQSRFVDHYLFSEEPKHSAATSYDPALLQLAGTRLAMPGPIAFAKKQLKAVLSGTSDFNISMQGAILNVVAEQGDIKDFSAYQKAYLNSQDESLKAKLLNAMGYFSAADIVSQYYEFLLSDKVPVEQFDFRFQFPAYRPELRVFVASYIRDNSERILAKMPPSKAQWFPYVFMSACSSELETAVTEIFSSWPQSNNLQEKLQLVLSNIQDCQRTRKNSAEELAVMLGDR